MKCTLTIEKNNCNRSRAQKCATYGNGHQRNSKISLNRGREDGLPSNRGKKVSPQAFKGNDSRKSLNGVVTKCPVYRHPN
jgi:hypothetical protein